MMIIEPPIAAVRFPNTAKARYSAGVPQIRSMWSSTEDVNAAGYFTSCQLACCSCSFDVPWVRSKKNTGASFTRRNKLVKNRVRASSEHLGSAQDPEKKNEKPSYHPSEEIAASTLENSGDPRLTAAETSRTIIEVNSKATLMFSSLINDENIIWPDLPYLTDEHGNMYFQVKKSEDILQSLNSENNFVFAKFASLNGLSVLYLYLS